MTREEAIEILQGAIKKPNTKDGYLGQAIDMAIVALEQEPCEDAISRQAVLKTIQDWWKRTMMADGKPTVLRESIRALPPVTPKQKTGHWIKSRDCYGNNHFTCPFCEHDIATKSGTWKDNYCSNCGAKMESEEKE